ncbi:hypothetical protein K3495_g7745 [Podosphaera aphanis]|nr:hypothetical protein K3495_g7745 [Podosphaera aphanis]
MKHVNIFTTLALLCATLTTATPSSILSKRSDHCIAEGYMAVCDWQNQRRHYDRNDAIQAATSAKRHLEDALSNGGALEDVLRSRQSFPSIYLGKVDGYQAPFMIFPIGRGMVYTTAGLFDTNVGLREHFVDLVVLDKDFKVARILNGETPGTCSIIFVDYQQPVYRPPYVKR